VLGGHRPPVEKFALKMLEKVAIQIGTIGFNILKILVSILGHFKP